MNKKQGKVSSCKHSANLKPGYSLDIYFVMDYLSVSALKVMLHQLIGIDGGKKQLQDQR